jgi:hypothetical protein
MKIFHIYFSMILRRILDYPIQTEGMLGQEILNINYSFKKLDYFIYSRFYIHFVGSESNFFQAVIL